MQDYSKLYSEGIVQLLIICLAKGKEIVNKEQGR